MQMSRDDTPELCRKVWPKSTVWCHLVFHYDHNNRYATSSLAVIHISFCLHVRCFGATHCEIFSADLEEKMAELAHPIPQDEERTNPNCFIRIVYMALGTMFLSWEGSVCVCLCVREGLSGQSCSSIYYRVSMVQHSYSEGLLFHASQGAKASISYRFSHPNDYKAKNKAGTDAGSALLSLISPSGKKAQNVIWQLQAF